MLEKKSFDHLWYLVGGLDPENKGLEFEPIELNDEDSIKWTLACQYFQLCGELDEEIKEEVIEHKGKDYWITGYEGFKDWMKLG
ncbi:MAG: hypothetical protein AAGB46_08125, partial [Verrucomicrobiota bacterium]